MGPTSCAPAMPLATVAMLPEVLTSAPPVPTPVPWRTMGSLTAPMPFKSSVEPEFTVVVPVAVFWRPPKPRPVLLPSFTVPPPTVVAPVYLFAPASVSVPVPTLVKARPSADSETTALMVRSPVPPLLLLAARSTDESVAVAGRATPSKVNEGAPV